MFWTEMAAYPKQKRAPLYEENLNNVCEGAVYRTVGEGFDASIDAKVRNCEVDGREVDVGGGRLDLGRFLGMERRDMRGFLLACRNRLVVRKRGRCLIDGLAVAVAGVRQKNTWSAWEVWKGV